MLKIVTYFQVNGDPVLRDVQIEMQNCLSDLTRQYHCAPIILQVKLVSMACIT